MSVLIFLGAGASKPFGIPTMTDLVVEFETKIKNEHSKEQWLYHNIKETLEKGFQKSQIDIESIFTVISGISNSKSPKEMGAYPYYYIKKYCSEQKFSDTDIEHAKNLKNKLEEFIREKCNVNPEILGEIGHETYDPFFKYASGISTGGNHDKIFPVGWKAYTTNYDLIFENYFYGLSSPIEDFFTYNNSPIGYFDASKNLERNQQTLVKLHGSIDWERLEDNSIMKTSQHTFSRTKKIGKAMIYPIQQKDLYLHPWIRLFEEFKTGLRLSDIWYVIGYAFNDEFIREIFTEIFTEKKKLILINPDATEIIKKFPEEKRHNIISLPIRFGGKYFAQDFEDFEKNQRTIEIQLESESAHMGIDFPQRVENYEVLERDKINDTVTINHHDSNTFFDVGGRLGERKKFKFKVILKQFSKYTENIEFSALSSQEKPVYVTLYNQNRFICSFTGNKDHYDDFHKRYFSKPQKIPIKQFWLK